MHVFVCASVCEFRERNFFKGGRMYNLGKLEIFKNRKMIIIIIIIIIINWHNGLGKLRKFSRSRITKWIASLNSSREI